MRFEAQIAFTRPAFVFLGFWSSTPPHVKARHPKMMIDFLSLGSFRSPPMLSTRTHQPPRILNWCVGLKKKIPKRFFALLLLLLLLLFRERERERETFFLFSLQRFSLNTTPTSTQCEERESFFCLFFPLFPLVIILQEEKLEYTPCDKQKTHNKKKKIFPFVLKM